MKSELWQRKGGKSDKGGLNQKGRDSYNHNHKGSHLKAPCKSGPRHVQFCKRMKGMKAKNTGSQASSDPNSRINKSLRRWGC